VAARFSKKNSDYIAGCAGLTLECHGFILKVVTIRVCLLRLGHCFSNWVLRSRKVP
jgi:hypothetical protein